MMTASIAITVKEEALAKRSYLDGIHISQIQADVELLSGTSASKLLEV